MNNHTKFNSGGVVPDPLLRELAKRFNQLPEFPDPDLARGEAIVSSGRAKHLVKLPGMPVYAVRHFIGGKNRYLAFVSKDRLDDGLRMADALTFRLWKYRQRGAEHLNEKQFNFSSDAARQDLADWTEHFPEIVTLIDEIENHFLEMEITADPTERGAPDLHSSAARRTVRGELRSLGAAVQTDAADRHQEIMDGLAALSERLDDVCKRLDAIKGNSTRYSCGPAVPPPTYISAGPVVPWGTPIM